jgi:predicted acetyltransferase
MNILLKQLEISDGKDVFEMFRSMGKGENGFNNYYFDEDGYEEFKKRRIEESNGINLKEDYCPQTIYILYIDGYPVGYSKLRHYLTKYTKVNGGHIGRGIRPDERGKGYGSILLAETLKEARRLGIDRVLITTYEYNIAARKSIEKNSGKLENIVDGLCRYWIEVP